MTQLLPEPYGTKPLTTTPVVVKDESATLKAYPVSPCCCRVAAKVRPTIAPSSLSSDASAKPPTPLAAEVKKVRRAINAFSFELVMAHSSLPHPDTLNSTKAKVD